MQATVAAPLTLDTYPLSVPFRCCNCGRQEELLSVETPWEHAQLLLNLSITRRWSFALPYCEPCAPSARRLPLSLSVRLTVAVFAAIATAMGMEYLGGQALLESDVGLAASLVAGVLVYGAMLAWTAGHKALPGQTSYYQPVRLAGLRQRFGLGRAMGLKLAFTNAEFEREFRQANQVGYDARILESKVLARG